MDSSRRAAEEGSRVSGAEVEMSGVGCVVVRAACDAQILFRRCIREGTRAKRIGSDNFVASVGRWEGARGFEGREVALSKYKRR